jgi:hypothetical protein
LPHVEDHGRPGRPVADEGAEDPALGDQVGGGLPPLLAAGGAERAEGPLDQVKLRVQVVAGAHGPDQDFRMVNHEQPPYGSRAARSSSLPRALIRRWRG